MNVYKLVMKESIKMKQIENVKNVIVIVVLVLDLNLLIV